MNFPMPHGDPCFFCEIASGSSRQWQIVEQDELTMTLLMAANSKMASASLLLAGTRRI